MTIGMLILAVTLSNVLGAALFHFFDGALKGWLALRHPHVLTRWMGMHGRAIDDPTETESDEEIDARIKREAAFQWAMFERMRREQERRDRLLALGVIKEPPAAPIFPRGLS